MASIKSLRQKFEAEKPGSAASNAAFREWKEAVDAKGAEAEESEAVEDAPAPEPKPKAKRRG